MSINQPWQMSDDEIDAILASHRANRESTVTKNAARNADQSEVGGYRPEIIDMPPTQSARKKGQAEINTATAYEERMTAARKERRQELKRRQTPPDGGKVTVSRLSQAELAVRLAARPVSPIDGKPILPTQPRTDVPLTSSTLASTGKRGVTEVVSPSARRIAARQADALIETGNTVTIPAGPVWEGGKTGKVTRDVEPLADVIPDGAGFKDVEVPVEQSGTAKVGNHGAGNFAHGSPKGVRLNWGQPV